MHELFLLSTLFFVNLFKPSKILTDQYPETMIPLKGHARYRTRHRLKARADGYPKCVACFMCETACPAHCIHIEAEEFENNSVEKYPKKFDIDLSRCVMCNLCVEACPEDAIIMDTMIIPGGVETREDLLLTKEKLMDKRGIHPIEKEISTKGAANRLANEFAAGAKK